MKSSKVSAVFLTKFSPILAKFKSGATINVAHQQIRKLFGQYAYSDIVMTFTSKMDTCDNLTDKEKKQYAKIYITLMDAYGQQVILNSYERLIQSISKKGFGVAEVVGHLCKTLLNRIYPTENIGNYIKHLLISFEKNIEISKIIKQIVQSFDPQLTAPFQEDMLIIIAEKINQPRFKFESLQAISSIILSLEHRFTQEHTIQSMVAKNFKSDDWNIRKICVDIAYGLLVVNNEANSVLHEYIKQLKYDKIKHVRDSVANYNAFYKQIYGDERGGQKKNTQQSESYSKYNKFSGRPKTEDENTGKERSKKKNINREFFQNAKNKDIIRVSDNKSGLIQANNEDKQQVLEKGLFEEEKKINNFVQENNALDFESYLKNKPTSYPETQNKRDNLSNERKKKQFLLPKSPRNKYQAHKNKKQETEPKKLTQISSIKAEFDTLKNYLQDFQKNVIKRIDALQQRVSRIETNKQNFPVKNQNYLEQSFKKRFNEPIIEENSASQYSNIEESNLPQKIRESIKNKNWDQAYTLALSNKNKEALFELLSHDTIPKDELIQNCLLMEVRKNLTNITVLKWLLSFVQAADISEETLCKIQRDLLELPEKIKGNDSENRNYWMLKKMITNALSERIFG